MDRKTPKNISKRENEKPQFVMFGKDINKFAATAVIALLLLITAVILVIVLAYLLQEQ